MASDSDRSFSASEGSHFSGRPAPPYHLFDILREFDTDFPATDVDSGHRRSGNETGQHPFRSVTQTAVTSDASSSEAGGCLLPPSSSSGSYLNYSESSQGIDRRLTDTTDAPSPDQQVVGLVRTAIELSDLLSVPRHVPPAFLLSSAIVRKPLRPATVSIVDRQPSSETMHYGRDIAS
jgi:hypothetical protein